MDFKAPGELCNSPSKVIPGKYHGSGRHSKSNCLQDSQISQVLGMANCIISLPFCSNDTRKREMLLNWSLPIYCSLFEVRPRFSVAILSTGPDNNLMLNSPVLQQLIVYWKTNINGLGQDCRISIANALEIPQSSFKPLICATSIMIQYFLFSSHLTWNYSQICSHQKFIHLARINY